MKVIDCLFSQALEAILAVEHLNHGVKDLVVEGCSFGCIVGDEGDRL